MHPAARDVPGIVAPPPLLYLGAFLLGLGAEWLRPLPIVPPRLAHVIGGGLLVLGVIGFAGIWAFRRAGTTPNPYRPTTALVVAGPYRLTRNPMYLGFTLMYLGVTFWVNTLWPLLLLPIVLIVMQRGVIAREEAYLERRFGDEYRRYKARVRRWL
jgi:protein-S-isoprenylcysteine O-methyltransferase Ste14